MKSTFFVVNIFLFCFMATSCSPIDSVRPFDQAQAAVLVKNMQKKYERSMARSVRKSTTT
jgi:hypothetical protein